MSPASQIADFLQMAQTSFRYSLASDAKEARIALQTPFDKATKQISRVTSQLALKTQNLDQTEEMANLPIIHDLQRVVLEALQPLERAITTQAEKMQNRGGLQGMVYGNRMLVRLDERPTPTDPNMLRALNNYTTAPGFAASIQRFADYHAAHLVTMIYESAARRMGINATVARIVGYYDDFPRADAERIVRTVQLYAARRGTIWGYQEIPLCWRGYGQHRLIGVFALPALRSTVSDSP